MSYDNKAIVRRYIEEIYNKRNLEIADELVTENYVNNTGFETVKGIEGLRQFATMLGTAFPDAHETIEDQVAEGNKEVHRWIIRGTHQGEFLGIPPTGKQVSVTGITVAHIAEGKIAEEWTSADMMGLLQQLGVMPSSGES
jgi:steroid delta-isomerase-like uncharacterized protein